MYRKVIYIAIFWTFFLIILGAYVRLSDAGLGCPDWPGCYGQITVPHSEQALATAQSLYPAQPVEIGKAWKEMAHRYVAAGLGILIALIIGLSIKQNRTKRLGLPLLLGLTVILQAALGMWTVTLLLKPAIVTAHLVGGMLTLALLVLLYIRQQPDPQWQVIPLRGLALLMWAVLLSQIMLGGWVSSNYAALACYEFPQCRQGLWIPPMDFTDAFHFFRELGRRADGGYLSTENLTAIHWLHRVGAIVTSVIGLYFVARLMRYHASRQWGIALLSLLILQVSLGIGNVIFSLPLWMAVAHNGVAAAWLALLTVINGRLWFVEADNRKKR